MKFLTKPRKHLEGVVFLLSYFAFLAVLMDVLPQYLVWHALPQSPEPIEKIYFVFRDRITVTTTSNKRFTCHLYNEEECWVEDYDTREEWVPLACGEILHNEQTVQFSQPCYSTHGGAGHSTSFSLNDDGLVYAKQMSLLSPFDYFLGAVFGAVCASIFFLARVLIAGIISRFSNA